MSILASLSLLKWPLSLDIVTYLLAKMLAKILFDVRVEGCYKIFMGNVLSARFPCYEDTVSSLKRKSITLLSPSGSNQVGITTVVVVVAAAAVILLIIIIVS